MSSPPITDLPVETVVDDLRAALAQRGAAVLVAPPGAGKTTIVPLRLLDERWLGGQKILVLQPRRVVARASARRMAEMLGEEVGATVGYRTGEDRRVGRRTPVEVVTEGILTRQIQADPELGGVGLVVFDEFHERHLQSDLGLALCLDVRRALRDDLRLLVMSATIDAEGVAAVLGDPAPQDRPAPVVVSRGRQHPVEIRWRPPGRSTPVVDTVARVIGEALADHGDGDILAFLPGVAEIRRVQAALGQADADVRPLHGSLSPAEQDRALAPAEPGRLQRPPTEPGRLQRPPTEPGRLQRPPTEPGRRKVVLATDLAESSLTVDGVTVVVDAGLSRKPYFDPGTGLTRLQTAPASAASADQRAGRAGRTRAGIAYRLWDQGGHRTRRSWPEPEITTVDLTALALELAVWGSAADQLSWVSPPPPAGLERGRSLLVTLGALRADDTRSVTPLGQDMASLGAHPRLAAIVCSAADADRWTACVLAATVEGHRETSGRSATADLTEAVRRETTDREVMRRAERLARRAGWSGRTLAMDRAGALVARGYPDRLAQARGGGRLRLRSGTGLRLPEGDPLAGEDFVVVVDTGGTTWGGAGSAGAGVDRTVRLAVAIDQGDVEAIGGKDVIDRTELFWDDQREDLRARKVRHLDALVLASVVTMPAPGAETVSALLEVIAQRGLDELGWTTAARSLQHQAVFAHAHDPAGWPDCSDAALLAEIGDWLAPRLARATGRAALSRVDMADVLRRRLEAALGRLRVLVPGSLTLASGRTVVLDYTDDGPRLRARVQDLYGTTTHPSVLGGRVPVVVEILSPAGRPLQVTADLPGFWAGSWKQVRREMAGRYPKHRWPVDPTVGDARRPSN